MICVYIQTLFEFYTIVYNKKKWQKRRSITQLYQVRYIYLEMYIFTHLLIIITLILYKIY